jgi:thiol-activated cytolysin
LSLGGVSTLWAQDTAKISQYIETLKYDPRKLLAVRESGSIEALPSRTEEGTTLILCTSRKETLDGELDKITTLVRANANLAAGKPDLITLAPGPLTLSINLPNLGKDGSVLVAEPKQSTVQAGIDKMLAVWFKDSSNVQAAHQFLETKKAYSSDQVALSLGVRAKWGGGNMFKLDSSLNRRASMSTCISLFKQVYYTVSVDPPEHPGNAFGPRVTLGNVQSVANASAPPAYVKSMDYGRIIMIRMDTESTETQANLENALNYATSGGKGEGVKADLKAKYENITSSSKFTVVTLGGNAKEATEVMQGSKVQEKLFKLIQGSAKFNKANPAYPIAYTVNFLKDNAVASIACTTDYMETDCKTLAGGFLRLKNDAAVIGAFQVSWVDKDEKGKPVPKFWESGRCLVGYTHTIQMSPEVTKIHVLGRFYNGSSWREVINETAPAPNNMTYRMKGTAFGPTWEMIK